METIHIKGFAEKIDITESLSDNYNLNWSFNFEEESEDVIRNVFFRFYECEYECSLEEAIKGHLQVLFGSLSAQGQETGYSEYTIDGFDINTLRLGGHDIGDIIRGKKGKYLHILIDVIPEKKN